MTPRPFLQRGGPVEALQWEWTDAAGMVTARDAMIAWVERVTGLTCDQNVWRHPPRPGDTRGPIASPLPLVAVDPYTADLVLRVGATTIAEPGSWIVAPAGGPFTVFDDATFRARHQPLDTLTVEFRLLDPQAIADGIVDVLRGDPDQ